MSSRAETMLRIIHTMFAMMPSDNDERELFGEEPFASVEHVVSHLTDRFQINPLFTPEFAEEHQEIEIMADCIAVNPSWPLPLVVEYAMEDGTERTRQAVAREILYHRNGAVMDSIRALIGEPTFTPRILFLHISRTQPVSFDVLLKFVKDEGGFHDAETDCYAIANVMRNPTLPFGTAINLAAATGVPDASYEWTRNPFQFPGKKNTRTSIGWFRNENPDNLRELLGHVTASKEHIRILMRADPKRHVPKVYNCLVMMIAENPAWDPQMEAVFGDAVWTLLWDALQIMYASTGRFVEYSPDRINLRTYLHHSNPSWCLSERMCFLYANGGMSEILHLPDPDRPYRHGCSSIAFREDHEHVLLTFRRHFLTGFAKKRMLRTKDIAWLLTVDPSLSMDTMETIVEQSSLMGDAGEKITSFLVRNWVIPRRRARAIAKVRMLLSKAECLSTQQVGSYHYLSTAIASYLTA